jgi:large subunit ribosomal protein L28
MAMRCANCNRGVMYGHNVSHAKNRTRKIFKPNLHAARIKIGTTSRKVKLCTKCLRMYKRAQQIVAEAAVPAVTEAAQAA